WTARAAGDPLDRRRQLRGVYRVSDLDRVVEDDAIGVVDDLRLVAELHGLAQPALADRAGVGIMQADQPGGRLGHHPGQPATGLRHHPLSALDHGVEVVDRLLQSAFTRAARAAERASGVAQYRGGLPR